MIKSGGVIACKLLMDKEEVDDNVSCQLPSVEMQTAEIKGAGILGAMDMPVTGQLNSMTFTINLRSVNKNHGKIMKPGVRDIELRFVRDVITSEGQTITEGTKIFITGVIKKYDPGKVEPPSTMEGSAEFETLRFRIVVDGTETLLIDKLNGIYQVNGVDHMKNIRAVLG